MYSVSAVTRLTGIRPETLRAWEARYQAVVPGRTGSGRRTYSQADVERLRRLSALVDMGHRIGQVGVLDDAELEELVEAAVPGIRSPEVGLLRDLVAAVENYRLADLDERLGLALATLAPGTVAVDILAPLLHTIGDRWATGQMSIAQERLVSATVRARVLRLIETCSERRGAARLVFGTLSGERHELGILVAAFYATRCGATAVFLGADLPVAEFLRVAGETRPQVIALGFTSELDDARRADVRELERALPRGQELWLGGGRAPELKKVLGGRDTRIIEDFDAYRGELDRLLARRPARSP